MESLSQAAAYREQKLRLIARSYDLYISGAADTAIALSRDDFVYLSLSPLAGRAALPFRPAAACRKPRSRGSSASLRPFGCGPPLTAGLPVAFRRPPRSPGNCGAGFRAGGST